jgi:hypothetical protein
VSQQRLQDKPTLRAPVVAGRHAQGRPVPHAGRRLRVRKGSDGTVGSKQEAEKVWEPKFIAEIASGKDPRSAPDREGATDRPATVADLLTLYRTRYINVEPLKSRDRMLSQLNALTAELGDLPAKGWNVRRLSRTSRRDRRIARSQRRIGISRVCATSLTGRSVAISSQRPHSIVAGSESRQRASDGANVAPQKRRSSDCSTRANS